MTVSKKGTSLVEVTVICAILGMLSLIMVPSLTSFKETSYEKTATQSLIVVRAALLTNYNSRGSWLLDDRSLDNLFVEENKVSTLPSLSSSMVSVSLLATDSSNPADQAVGLAVMGAKDRCYSLVVYPPKHNSTYTVVKTKLSEGEVCSGSTAR